MRQFDIAHVDPEMMDVVKEFPKIFLEPSEYISQWLVKYPDNMPKKEDLVNLRYGFEHGIGWKEIVRGFCKEIQEFCDDKPIQYKGCIMKEKFGRFTPQGGWEGDQEVRKQYWKEICDIENKWEEKSTHVCEKTGKPGRLRHTDTGWVRTLSEEEMGKQYKVLER